MSVSQLEQDMSYFSPKLSVINTVKTARQGPRGSQASLQAGQIFRTWPQICSKIFSGSFPILELCLLRKEVASYYYSF